jgi:hypothetical protein
MMCRRWVGEYFGTGGDLLVDAQCASCCLHNLLVEVGMLLVEVGVLLVEVGVSCLDQGPGCVCLVVVKARVLSELLRAVGVVGGVRGSRSVEVRGGPGRGA